jgi:hypothetical protein
MKQYGRSLCCFAAKSAPGDLPMAIDFTQKSFVPNCKATFLIYTDIVKPLMQTLRPQVSGLDGG